MKCLRCGLESHDQAKFCSECGLSLQATRLGRTAVVPAADDVTLVGAPADVTLPGNGLPRQDDATFVGSPADVTPSGGATADEADATMSGQPHAAPSPPGPAPAGSEGPLRIGQQFGRYVIIRLLGLGGMGAVYQAWDEELEIPVAVKVIRPEVTADSTVAQEFERRFKRELLLARQVTHKNVVRIHDLGELDGIKYITMSYVNGTDLSTTLQREGRLPVARVLKILRGVVSGLTAAHDAGVVHRDLKPANIMVEAKSDEPLIMDFGIARSAATAATPAGSAGRAADVMSQSPSALTNATMAGAIVGTVGYMAPEQARGEDVDQRADLYSLGLICYDLLLGPKRLDASIRPMDELRARLEKSPPSLVSVDPSIPEAVDRLVMRCLEPDPAARFQNASELAAELARLDDNGVPLPELRSLTRRLAAVAVLGAALLTGGTYWLTRPVPPKPAPPLTTVLVADFDDRTNSPVFKGTLEQALTTGVEGASFITAYPRQGAQRLATEIKPGSRLDAEMARLISAREGIRVVLAGRIEGRGSGYVVQVDAIDPAANKVLTTASATAVSRAEVLAAVGSTAARLRRALGDTTAESAQASSETATTSSLEALQAYSRAQELADANKIREALAAYQETVKLDPNFGRAWAGMGVIYAATLKDEARAKAAYEEALKHVDRMTDREKLRTLGTYYLTVARNNEKAIENYETLVKLYPADDAGHGNLGLAYLYVGNLPRAIAEARQVLQIYPSQWIQRYNYAMYEMYAGHFDVAMKEGARVTKEAPSFALGFLPVALSKLATGDVNGARETYRLLQQSGPDGASLARFGLADLDMYFGRNREALEILRSGLAADGKAGDGGALARGQVAAAEAYLALGQKARAIEAARRAVGLSGHEGILVPAALVFIETGRSDEAEKIAVALENMLQIQTIAYGRLIKAEIAASRGRHAEAIDAFRDSIKRRDTWFARYLLGRLYARTEHFPEAMAELDLCAKRAGEVTDVFLADTPSMRYLPPAFYWLARAQHAMGVATAHATYDRFLALRGESDPPDPLVLDAKKWLSY
jgi:serine/threonine protein kinase/tetratricopeptide (TPR) repeat protein